MKRIGLLIVLFIGFSAINGYGKGDIDKSRLPEEFRLLPEKVQTVEGDVKTIRGNVETIQEDDKTRDDRLAEVEKKLPKDPSPTPVPPGNGPDSIPINWEIIREQKDNLGGLNYYVSKDISLTIPGSAKTGKRIRDGILEEIKYDERPEVKLGISQNDPGKMLKFFEAPGGQESMEIFFSAISAQSAIFTFTRNKTKNCFELTSVRKDGREFVFKGEAIQLYIKYKSVSLGRTTGETGTLTPASGQHREPPQTERRGGPPLIPQKILLERGQEPYLKRAAVIDYMENHNRSSWFNRRYDDISALVNAYFEIAKDEQVNPEIALAQMWYATRALSHDALLRNCNYAGLEPVGPFKGRFINCKTGVRAHIQHLKGYASKNRPKNIVDPRYEILAANGYLGRGTTLGELSKWWSPNKNYAAEINGILKTLYQYQHRYNSRR